MELSKKFNYPNLPRNAILYWAWKERGLSIWDAKEPVEYPLALDQSLANAAIIVLHLGGVDLKRVDEARRWGAGVSSGRGLVTEYELSRILDMDLLNKTWFINDQGEYIWGPDWIRLNPIPN